MTSLGSFPSSWSFQKKLSKYWKLIGYTRTFVLVKNEHRFLFLEKVFEKYVGEISRKNNKGVLERPGTKWVVLRAISSTLKCQFTGKCWKVDFSMPCKTKSAEHLHVWPFARCGHPGNLQTSPISNWIVKKTVFVKKYIFFSLKAMRAVIYFCRRSQGWTKTFILTFRGGFNEKGPRVLFAKHVRTICWWDIKEKS
jgi:hypothetical protein